MKQLKLGTIFALYFVVSWVSSTLSLAQIPPIPTAPPVQFIYTIPNQPLDQSFKEPVLSGAGGRKLYLDVSAPQGTAGNAETKVHIKVTAGISTEVGSFTTLRARLFQGLNV